MSIITGFIASSDYREYSRRSIEGRANLQEVKNACVVLNTAEYCQNTSLQLEERLKDKIDPNLKDDISFEPERGNFTKWVFGFLGCCC